MHTAAQALVGEHDFSGYRAAGCQSRSPYRYVHTVSVRRTARLVVIDITANAFLLHMVRNIAGVLIETGLGRQPATWAAELLEGRDRSLAARTAPPDGLYLAQVKYPGYDFPSPEPPGVLAAVGSLDRL
jgi:tRNA pseudouridine38-40 synthase